MRRKVFSINTELDKVTGMLIRFFVCHVVNK